MSDYKFRTVAYLRLSKGDGDVDGTAKNESNSISNQRTGKFLSQLSSQWKNLKSWDQ